MKDTKNDMVQEQESQELVKGVSEGGIVLSAIGVLGWIAGMVIILLNYGA